VPEALDAPGWQEGRVTRSWAESTTLRGLAFRCEAVARAHALPGQVVRVRLDGDEKPYALASEPGPGELELLFKAETSFDALAALEPGARLQVSLPEGAGFPVADHEGRDLILCAAGSGIAPLRAVVRTILPRRRSYGAVTLFYGQRDTSHFAYSEEWPGWRAAGIDVVPLVSGDSDPRVPEAVAERRPRVANAVAYVAGMKPMIREVSRVLVALGLPEERIFLNY
jgi:NAD(P)H-flavin reductase